MMSGSFSFRCSVLCALLNLVVLLGMPSAWPSGSLRQPPYASPESCYCPLALTCSRPPASWLPSLDPFLSGCLGSCWRAGNVTTATIAICRRERSSQRTGQPRLPNMRKHDYEPFAVRCSGTGSMRGRYMYSIKLASEREVETSDGLHQVALNSRNAAITAS